MIDVTDRLREACSKRRRSPISRILFPESLNFRNTFEFPTFVSPTVYEVHAKGEEIPCFNIALPDVMYQKEKNGRKHRFQLSDTLSVIDAYELIQPLFPWNHIYQKLNQGDRILVIGFFEQESIGICYYELIEQRGKPAPKPGFLEKLVLSPARSPAGKP